MPDTITDDEITKTEDMQQECIEVGMGNNG